MSENRPNRASRVKKGATAAVAGLALMGATAKFSYDKGETHGTTVGFDQGLDQGRAEGHQEGREQGIEETAPAAYTLGYIDGGGGKDEDVKRHLPNPVIDQLAPVDVLDHIDEQRENGELPQQLPHK